MKKPSIIKTILSFLLKVIVVAVLMVAIAFGSFQGVTKYITGSFYDFKKAQKADNDKGNSAVATTEEVKIDEKDIENTLLFIDGEDGITQYIILSMLNKETHALDLIFIPENGQVQISKDIQKLLAKRMDGISGTVLFRDLERAYHGETRYELMSDILAELLNIKISGWDYMNASSAKAFLDTVKYVPMNLDSAVTYRDTSAELRMIPEGEQEMDSEDAFAYMTYLDGTASQESDRLERVDTYMAEFLSRLKAKKKTAAIMDAYQMYTENSKDRNYDALTEAFKSCSDTDFITLRILQGNESGDVFDIDSQKAQIQISTLIKQAASYSSDDSLGKDSDDDSDEDSFDEEDDSKNLSIEIYNAAFVQGLASEWEYYLEDKGYNITLVDTYQQEGPLSTTRIIVDKEGIGEDLLKYFSGADISVGDIDTGGDIQIYVGTDHTKVGE